MCCIKEIWWKILVEIRATWLQGVANFCHLHSKEHIRQRIRQKRANLKCRVTPDYCPKSEVKLPIHAPINSNNSMWVKGEVWQENSQIQWSMEKMPKLSLKPSTPQKRPINRVWPHRNCSSEPIQLTVERWAIFRSEPWLWVKKWARVAKGQERQFWWEKNLHENSSQNCQKKNQWSKHNEWWPKLSNFSWPPKRAQWRFSRWQTSFMSKTVQLRHALKPDPPLSSQNLLWIRNLHELPMKIE